MPMTLPAGIDPDLLRVFAFIAEDGSFTRAAERVGRTQSAVSMQVQRLEGLLGQKLFSRGKGGAVQLTSHGQYLLDRARELLALHDEILRTFRAPVVAGTVRLGSPDDYAFRYLPQILKRFAASHPAVEVEVRCAPSEDIVKSLELGELDLALVTEGHEKRGAVSVELWRGALRWITADRHSVHRMDPLPLALATQGCAWRQTALRALEGTGRRWRVAYSSSTLAGTTAPVLAGLAVTVSTISWLPAGLRALRPDEGLPVLPETAILLMRGASPRQPVTDVLAAHIEETFRQDAGGLRVAAE